MTMQDIQLPFKKQNGTDSVQNLQSEGSISSESIRSYRRRFWMLTLFSTLSTLSGMLFPLYASVADVTMCFYGVSEEAVNWTCLIFMVVYIVFVFPVSWLMGKIGLRMTVIMGSVCSTAALAVQFASLTPESFRFVILSAFFGSLSNVFVLAIPPCLAAAWFPSEEVSRACAMGVFGNQLGVALGFVVSPLLISGDCSHIDLIADGKKMLAIIFTSCNAIILLLVVFNLIADGKKILAIIFTSCNDIILFLVVFTFQNEPQHPPSIAQAKKKNLQESYLHSALTVIRNVHFVLVFIMYGLVVGTYFAVATLLNNLMMHYFPGANVAIGWMGLTVIVAGLLGSIISGYILDYTHRFKETSISVCTFSFLSYVVFSFLLPMNKLWIQFVTLGVLGIFAEQKPVEAPCRFFMTSFLPVGFEYGIEVTYPESEITSAGLLNSATMLFGIIITEIASSVLRSQGPTYANVVLGVALLLSAVISCFITRDYKRSKKKNEVTTVTRL